MPIGGVHNRLRRIPRQWQSSSNSLRPFSVGHAVGKLGGCKFHPVCEKVLTNITRQQGPPIFRGRGSKGASRGKERPGGFRGSSVTPSSVSTPGRVLLVEPRGFEPLTSALQRQRSTN